MNRVEKLLRAYISEFRGGGRADPQEFLAKVSGTDRAELAVLIDGFLAETDPPPFDPEAFSGLHQGAGSGRACGTHPGLTADLD
jgi:hypothetical protein